MKCLNITPFTRKSAQHDLAELYTTHVETPRTKLAGAVIEGLGDFVQQTAHALRQPALDALITALWRR